MKTEAEIRTLGMQALIAALGLVEAERFVAALSRDRFDYTQWRRTGLPDTGLDTLAAEMPEDAASQKLRIQQAFEQLRAIRSGLQLEGDLKALARQGLD